MTDAAFAIPGYIESPTGGYAYDRRILALLPGHGIHVRHVQLPGSFPHPTADDIAVTARALAEIPSDEVLLFDGLAYGAMPSGILRKVPQPIVAIVHHPLSFEPDLTDARRRALHASETAALALARAVIVSSPTTRAVLSAEFGVAPERIVIAEPGTVQTARAKGSESNPTILAVGAITPRKAYDVLVDALHRVADRPWRAIIVGSVTRNPAAATELIAHIASRNLTRRVLVTGEIADARLAKIYERADVFVLSSFYEGYGMALAEAMARGLAIVSTTAGAAAETVPNEAALKVPPGDAPALAAALAQLLDDVALRQTIADASWRAGQELPHWDKPTAIIADAIRAAAL